MAKKQVTFILDRPDFKRLQEILPPSEHRDQLAERLREARAAYEEHRARRPQILAELEKVGLQLAETPGDTKLGARAAALSAELGVLPKVAAERARAYAEAFTAWASLTYRHFQFVGNEAADKLSEFDAAWSEAIRRESRLPYNSPERKQNEETIQRLKAQTAPLHRTRRLCENGMGHVEVALSNALGATVIKGVPRHGSVEKFVHRIEQAAA